MTLSRGKGVARDHRVVDELEVDLKAVFLGKHRVGIGGKAVVGRDNGEPANPDIDRELDDLRLSVPLVCAHPLDRRQPFLGHVLVLADGCDALWVKRLAATCGNLSLLVTELGNVDVAVVTTREKRVLEEIGGPGEACSDDEEDQDLGQGGRTVLGFPIHDKLLPLLLRLCPLPLGEGTARAS